MSSYRRLVREGAQRLGVRALLFMVIGSSAVVPVGLLGLTQAERWGKSELAAADRQALGAARAAADQLSLAMIGYVHAAEAFSAQIGYSGRLDRESLEMALAAHVHHHPEFLGAYVANAAGRSLVNLNDGRFLAGGIDYSDRAYYRQVASTGRTAISSVHVGRVTGVLTVQVAAPIRDARGILLGLTCSSVDLGTITDQAKQTVRAMHEGRVLLIDGQGRRIADSSAAGPLGPENVSAVAPFAPPRSAQPELRLGVDDRGREVRGFVVSLAPPVSGWHALALTPQSAIDAQARRVKWQTLVLVLALGLGALLIAARLAAWLARPLQALAASALAVTRGDFESLPAVPRKTPLEMAQLTRAVRTMIERLRGHARDLEQQVAARTAELSRANAEISQALDTIRQHEQLRDADLSKARLFQAKLLPTLPRLRHLTFAAHYAPLHQVSGDIYDVTEVEPGLLRVFLADATGHGVQASMRTLILKRAYDALKLRCAEPRDVLSQLNTHLIEEFPEGDLNCSACCVDLRPGAEGARVTYANAGSPPLYVLSARSAPWERYAEGPLLGVDQVTWPASSRFPLELGQVLMIASDGLFEQTDARRQRFDSRLSELDLGPPGAAAHALTGLLREFEAFRAEQPASDDVTILMVACSTD